MVCTDGGVICVPKYSRSGEALCFPKTIKCDGTVDCEDGSDEDLATCAQKNTLSNPGVSALIAIAVIVAIALLVTIPIVFMIKKKRIPACLLPCWARIKKLRHRDGRARESSASQLNNGSRPTSQQLTPDKDGFTNVGFDHSTPDGATRPPPNHHPPYFQKEVERTPSIREWQASRLQSNSPKITKQNGSSTRPFGQEVKTAQIPSHGPNPGQVGFAQTYTPPTHSNEAQRPPPVGAETKPFTIASPDGSRAYENRTHVRQPYASAQASRAGADRPPWERTAGNSRLSSHQAGDYSHHNPSLAYSRPDSHLRSSQPPRELYGQQNNDSEMPGVEPRQLRNALEKVAMEPRRGRSYYSQYSPQASSSHDTSADTVV